MSDLEPVVSLRPFREPDLVLHDRYANERSYSAPFEWSGFRSFSAARRRWEDDGFLSREPFELVVAGHDDEALGSVSWRDPQQFGRPGLSWEIGILLAPEHRGRGVGTAAQRSLVEYLFETTAIHRICANTAAENISEQRALEKCGFRREGYFRSVGMLGGRWCDAVSYSLLRSESAFAAALDSEAGVG